MWAKHGWSETKKRTFRLLYIWNDTAPSHVLCIFCTCLEAEQLTHSYLFMFPGMTHEKCCSPAGPSGATLEIKHVTRPTFYRRHNYSAIMGFSDLPKTVVFKKKAAVKLRANTWCQLHTCWRKVRYVKMFVKSSSLKPWQHRSNAGTNLASYTSRI